MVNKTENRVPAPCSLGNSVKRGSQTLNKQFQIQSIVICSDTLEPYNNN